MKNRLNFIAPVLLGFLLFSGCSDRADFRGQTVKLPMASKLVTVNETTHGINYLVRPMRKGESPETFEFRRIGNDFVWRFEERIK